MGQVATTFSLSSLSKKIQKLFSSPTLLFFSLSPPPLLPIKAPNFAHHFYSKFQKEAIFGVVKRTTTLWDFKFQIVMAAQLIHDRVEMECLEGVWETLEGNERC
ncbi:hypothetical protein GmHk_17G049654 [Glycine max]|nr:hypothetical protein GmHk_17G049654 [Glycine max]